MVASLQVRHRAIRLVAPRVLAAAAGLLRRAQGAHAMHPAACMWAHTALSVAHIAHARFSARYHARHNNGIIPCSVCIMP